MALQERPPVEPSEPGQMDDRLSEFVGKYAVRAVAGIILVLIVVGLSLYFTDRSAAESARAWSRFARVAQGEDYKDDDAQAGAFATIADDFPGHPAGVWARLAEGEAHLRDGVGLQTSDRTKATAALTKAGKAFEALKEMGDVPVEVQMRADLCRVWLLEAECSGDTAGVISAYEGFLKNYPESIYKDHINERISALDAEDAKEFYAWFDSQNPKPSGLASALPLDGQQGLPSGHPTAPVTLPRIPEALFPSDWDELKLETLPEPGEAEGESKPTSDSAESGKEPGAAGTDESDSESDSGSDKAAVPESESSDGTESN